MRYADDLSEERGLHSVPTNTRNDGEKFLTLAARFDLRATTVAHLMATAPQALAELAHGRFSGAAMLHN